MSDPAYCNIPSTEATAAKIRENTDAAAEKVREFTDSAAAKVRQTTASTLDAAQRYRDRLQDRWQQMSERVSETAAQLPAIKQEIKDDAAYVADRARYYHQTRPLSTLGMVAAAAFVIGLGVGLGRR